LSAKAAAARAKVPLPPIRNKVEVMKSQGATKGGIFDNSDAQANTKTMKD